MTTKGRRRDSLANLWPSCRRPSIGRTIIVALAASFSLGTAAQAQSFTAGGAGGGPLVAQGAPIPEEHFVAPNVAPTSTILPTDVVPLPAAQERTSFGENLQLRVLQRLPAPFYFNASIETSVRAESNVFQFPSKRTILHELLPAPQIIQLQSAEAQLDELKLVNKADAFDSVFRILPNITWGWALKPRTRVYGNYFMIRDQLNKWIQLNTVIHSLGYGIQQDVPVGRRGNLQFDFQARELWQLHTRPRFDFLPGATFSYVITPRLVGFVNVLAQLRGKHYFQSPNMEIDPFYTWGAYYAKNGWAFSATNTFVQNFRQPFHSQATIPVNNYSMISDYEIARRLIRQLPGLQAYARAEPIWNFHGNQKPGLTGMDFRMYFGLRMQLGKPALTAAYEQIKQQLEEQETAPPPPGKSPGEAKPSAYLPMPYQVTADSSQPIHGTFDDQGNQTTPVSSSVVDCTSMTQGGTLPTIQLKPLSSLLTDATPSLNLTKPSKESPDPAAAPETAQGLSPDVVSQLPSNPVLAHEQVSPERKSVASELPTDSMAKTLEPSKPAAPIASTEKLAPAIAKPVEALVATNKPAEADAKIWEKPAEIAFAPVSSAAQLEQPAPAESKVADSNNTAGQSAEARSPQDEQRMIVMLPAAVAGPLPAATSQEVLQTASETYADAEQALHMSTSKSQKHKKETSKDKDKRAAIKKPLVTASHSHDVEMRLVPPLPTVNTDSKENPFQDSGLELKPPILMNPIR
jgi:hypothetical protein